ncbi:MAG: MBL fold metallo-hydrolase [Candidatus Magasanikbacteria bacterium]|nr:MBL fold metallo-hydrolase [Candidatus Magasanikbacteria bacterium]
MHLTFFGHSCLLIEENGARLMVDPGFWSEGHTEISGLDAIFITHEHPDHCDIESLSRLREHNQNFRIYTNKGVGKKLAGADFSFELLENGASMTVKGLSVEAFGQDHAVIYQSFPRFDNTGFLFDGRLFHPGDALNVYPDKPVEILALPVIAPWMRMADSLEYAKKIKPQLVFPIHDGMLKHVGPFHSIPKDVLGAEGMRFVVLEKGLRTEF